MVTEREAPRRLVRLLTPTESSVKETEDDTEVPEQSSTDQRILDSNSLDLPLTSTN